MSLLVYDSSCPYCSAIAKAASLSRQIETSPYQSGRAQERLEQEFDDPGFTLYLFGSERVFWGSKAAERTAELIGFPRFLLPLVVYTYPYLVRIFTVLSGRRPAEQPECGDDQVCHVSGSGGEKELREG